MPPALAPKPIAPYSNFSGILDYDSGATANYNSLQIFVPAAHGPWPSGAVSFTWQKTIDAASGAKLAVVQAGLNDPANLRYSRGISNASIPFTLGGPDTSPTDFTYTQVNNGQGSVTNVSRVGQAALKFTL